MQSIASCMIWVRTLKGKMDTYQEILFDVKRLDKMKKYAFA